MYKILTHTSRSSGIEPHYEMCNILEFNPNPNVVFIGLICNKYN